MANNVKQMASSWLEEIRIRLIRFRLWLAVKIGQAWIKLKTILFKVCIFTFVLSSGYFLYKNHSKISSYLIDLNGSSGSNSGLFSNIFVVIGASIIGVIAITFSLSLFAIQQAADKHTPSVLEGFLKDRLNLFIFWIITMIALIFIAFAVFPLNSLIFYEVVAGFILLTLTFALLQKQYHHATELINPNYQIIFRYKETIKGLEEIDKWLDLMIKIGAIRPGPTAKSSNNVPENTNAREE